jgi:uncharacterized protein YbbC (DUF1343 family)/CubicO group peptidase (beta-lactamase class C family)
MIPIVARSDARRGSSELSAMRAAQVILAVLASLVGLCLAATHAGAAAGPRSLSPGTLARIGGIVRDEIAKGHICGAVILVGQGDTVVYRSAFGLRTVGSSPAAMAADTIFDLASLTKVVATTTAVMQLAERGKLDLDAPVFRYWPRFAATGKQDITVRDLLTHYSGLKADLKLRHRWSGYRTAMNMLVADRPLFPPGTHYLYSDENFEILGELVRRVSGLPLDVYCERNIFGPLQMKDTGFRPPVDEAGRIAPTQWQDGRPGLAMVNDPTARRMGGVAGHAGLFSSADDLATFARMLLNGGRLGGVRILSRSSINEMTLPESPPTGERLRGLGWDVGAPLATNRDELFPAGSFGHTGFTGTMIWIDPVRRVYVIVLANRTYPDGRGDAQPLRKRIVQLVSEAMGPLEPAQVIASLPGLARYYPVAASANRKNANSKVATGVDVLAAEGFAPLRRRRIGLITNQTGRDAAGSADIDLFRSAPGVKLVAIFTPEHGLYGNRDEKIASGIDPASELPLFSLYGDVTRPTPAMLDGIDALVFDVQDIGTRFYTYLTTMAYAMETAAGQGIDFYVLDRPDPISAAVVQGPLLDRKLESFTGYYPLPVRYGMTIGELARMFNAENQIGARLHVIAMRGYQRADWYDDTGLRWIDPSPNLRSLTEAALYPGIALAEGANVSLGRGTNTPFEVAGAPWIDGQKLAAYLNRREIAGVTFEPADFTPLADRYKRQECHGVRIQLVDRDELNTPALGIELVSALYRLYPTKFQVDRTLGLIGSRRVLNAIKRGDDPRLIAREWQRPLRTFEHLRAKYLLY